MSSNCDQHYTPLCAPYPLGATPFSLQLGRLPFDDSQPVSVHTPPQYCIILLKDKQFFKMFTNCAALQSGIISQIPKSKIIKDWIVWHVDIDPEQLGPKLLLMLYRASVETKYPAKSPLTPSQYRAPEDCQEPTKTKTQSSPNSTEKKKRRALLESVKSRKVPKELRHEIEGVLEKIRLYEKKYGCILDEFRQTKHLDEERFEVMEDFLEWVSHESKLSKLERKLNDLMNTE